MRLVDYTNFNPTNRRWEILILRRRYREPKRGAH